MKSLLNCLLIPWQKFTKLKPNNSPAPTSSAIKTKKANLRAILREQRQAIPLAERQAHAQAICSALAQHEVLSTLPTVFFYASINAEPDLTALAEHWQAEKVLALPVVSADKMVFCRWQPQDKLVQGKFNIPEPATRQVLAADRQTLVLLPCLALDHRGQRLGYGGGYYDRFLATHPQVHKVGVCYHRFVQAQLPAEAHDSCVDYLVTERGVQAVGQN